MGGLARAEKPKASVLPFTGPQAKKAEAVVVRVLKKKTSLVPGAVYQRTAKKLFAPGKSADDIAAVAGELKLRIVVTGLVKRDGRQWVLSISVRDGTTGKSKEK